MEIWKENESPVEEVVENNVFLNSANDDIPNMMDKGLEAVDKENENDQSDDNNNDLLCYETLNGDKYEEMLLFSSADSPVHKKSSPKGANTPTSCPEEEATDMPPASGIITPPLAQSSPKKHYHNNSMLDRERIYHAIHPGSQQFSIVGITKRIVNVKPTSTSTKSRSRAVKPKMVSVLKNDAVGNNLNKSINRTTLGSYFANFSPDETTLRRIEPRPERQVTKEPALFMRVHSSQSQATRTTSRVSCVDMEKGKKALKERQRRGEMSDSLDQLKVLVPQLPRRCSTSETLDHIRFIELYLHLNCHCDTITGYTVISSTTRRRGLTMSSTLRETEIFF